MIGNQKEAEFQSWPERTSLPNLSKLSAGGLSTQILKGRNGTGPVYRSGEGEAEAVVLPGTLLKLWRVLQAFVAAGKIVIMQAANTGLTEGSTPSGSYDRDVVIINTRVSIRFMFRRADARSSALPAPRRTSWLNPFG